MQRAFQGHLVVLCDSNTSSDGEAFCEGFRQLGLGKVYKLSVVFIYVCISIVYSRTDELRHL